jgi:hypothetical protein
MRKQREEGEQEKITKAYSPLTTPQSPMNSEEANLGRDSGISLNK